MVNIPVFSGFYAFQAVQDFFHQQFHKFVQMAGNGWKVDQLTQEFSGFLLSEGIGRSCCKLAVQWVPGTESLFQETVVVVTL